MSNYLATEVIAMIERCWDRLPEPIKHEMVDAYLECMDELDFDGARELMFDNLRDDSEHCAESIVWITEALLDHFAPVKEESNSE